MDKGPEPDSEAHPEGGYGLYIIRSLMDKANCTRGSPFSTLAIG